MDHAFDIHHGNDLKNAEFGEELLLERLAYEEAKQSFHDVGTKGFSGVLSRHNEDWLFGLDGLVFEGYFKGGVLSGEQMLDLHVLLV